MELETDKAVVEVPSSVSGTVKEIRVKEGEKIKVGQVIFTFENGAGAKCEARAALRHQREANGAEACGVRASASESESAGIADGNAPSKRRGSASRPCVLRPLQSRRPPNSSSLN